MLLSMLLSVGGSCYVPQKIEQYIVYYTNLNNKAIDGIITEYSYTHLRKGEGKNEQEIAKSDRNAFNGPASVIIHFGADRSGSCQ